MNSSYGKFFSMLAEEIEGALAQHGPMHSLHEGYAVILEELDEVKEEVWKKPSKRDLKATLLELVQTAAMCVRTAVDCGLLNDEPQSHTFENCWCGRLNHPGMLRPGEPDVEIPRSAPVSAVGRAYKYALFMDAT